MQFDWLRFLQELKKKTIMSSASEGEGDWFEKDIDEFVVQAPPSNVEHISVSSVPDADTATLTNVVYTDAGLFYIFLPNLCMFCQDIFQV